MKNYAIPLTLITILADGNFHYKKILSNRLGLNLMDIHYHIKTLRNWGINIITAPKGYNLLEPIRLLDEKFIHDQFTNNDIKVLPIVNSTNQYLLDRIDNLSLGDICISEYQQDGRGRRKKKWFSPFGYNLYLSIYWHFKRYPTTIIGLSLVIGVVIARVLRKFGVTQIRLKWPNDLYLYGKKIAGILVEIIRKTGSMIQSVIGIGINFTVNNLPKEICNSNCIGLREAGINVNRDILAIQLIKELRTSLIHFEYNGLGSFISYWKELDNFINCPVKLVVNDQEVHGISLGIDNQGALLLYQNGIIKSWVNGDISLFEAK